MFLPLFLLLALSPPPLVSGGDNARPDNACLDARLDACLDAALDRARAYYDRPRCLHGLSCGDGCDGGAYVWKDDALDLACHDHKRCLESSKERCTCHAALRAFAAAVVADAAASPRPAPKATPKCAWWEILWCKEDDSPPPSPPPSPLQPLVQPCLTVIAGMNVELVRDGCV